MAVRPRCDLCGRFKRRVFPGTDIELRCTREYYDDGLVTGLAGWRHEYPQWFLGGRRRRTRRKAQKAG